MVTSNDTDTSNTGPAAHKSTLAGRRIKVTLTRQGKLVTVTTIH
jgi:hypothetical protein